MNESKICPITVVIPTLGGDCLKKTINYINNGTIVPQEIIICIPVKEKNKLPDLPFDNTVVLPTECRGQVQQRAEGFKVAKNDYVLQVDDDILLNNDALESMFVALERLGPGYVVGPSYYHRISLLPLHRYDVGVVGFFKNLNACVFSGAPWGRKRMGKLTHLGIAYGFDPEYSSDELQEVDWLPGGCVLSFSRDLITQDFFPLKGKAFSEDVMNSLLRKLNGCQHVVLKNVIVKTQLDEGPFTWKNFKCELNARLYVVKFMRGSKFRFFLWGISQYIMRKIV